MSLYIRKKMLVIAGPCALENAAMCEAVAEKLVELSHIFSEIQFIFSGSYDKANRTSLQSARGPGLTVGLSYLKAIKDGYGLPVSTDVHDPSQVSEVAQICDVLQIPAFLCRQTDLLAQAAQSRRIVNIKKGQFLSPYDMQFIVEKLKHNGAEEIWQTERGTTFGYNNLIVDMRSFEIMQRYAQPVIFDATHSVQLPGALKGKSGGESHFALPLAKAALAAGAQGLYLETHPCPKDAISDAQTQIPLEKLRSFLESCLSIWQTCQTMAFAE